MIGKINKRIIILSALSLIILAGIIFAYQKGNSFIGAKKKDNDVLEKIAVKGAVTGGNRADNLYSANIIDANHGDGSFSENDMNKEKKNAEVKEWIESVIGYKKFDSKVLNVPADFQKIQDAINSANRGDIVKVLEGEYKENITMKNGVSLEGEGADKVVLDGDGFGNVISFKNIRGSKTRLSGFTIRNAGKSLSGISIENSSPWIHDNIISDNEFGIYIKGESRPVIQKNVIRNSSKAIQAYNFKIDGDGGANAVKVEDEKPKDNPTKPIIIDNLITDNKIGIDLYNSSAVIEHNNISYNNHYKTYLGATYGISLSVSSANVLNNIITDNGICELCAGISADNESKSVIISYNDIWNNKNDYLCFGECVLGEGNVSENPLYADTLNGDYKLLPESSLIKKAGDGLDMGIRW